MRTLSILALAVAVLGVAGCRRQDVRTVEILVPAMKTEACAELVKKAIAGTPGVRHDQTTVDLSRRTVTVTYDSMVLALKNIEGHIASAGFDANDVPADLKAAQALPPECSR